MSQRKVTMPMRVATACLFTALPILMLLILWPDLSQALSPTFSEELAPPSLMDKQAVPPGSFVVTRGHPRKCTTIGPPTTMEACIVFREAPYLVLYSPHGNDLTRIVLGSDPGDEFFTTPYRVEGRIDTPPPGRVRSAELDSFVRNEIGPEAVSKVRVLYVDADPRDAQARAFLGGICGGFSLLMALAAWSAVIVALLRGGATAKPPPETDGAA